MEGKHKAGPWKVCLGRPEYQEMTRILAGGDGEHLIGYVLREDRNKEQQSEDDANAHLIKAAPDLLHVAERLLRSFEQGHLQYTKGIIGGPEQLATLRAVIARAKGS